MLYSKGRTYTNLLVFLVLKLSNPDGHEVFFSLAITHNKNFNQKRHFILSTYSPLSSPWPNLPNRPITILQGREVIWMMPIHHSHTFCRPIFLADTLGRLVLKWRKCSCRELLTLVTLVWHVIKSSININNNYFLLCFKLGIMSKNPVVVFDRDDITLHPRFLWGRCRDEGYSTTKLHLQSMGS